MSTSTRRETYLKFVKALSNQPRPQWGEAQDCVARDFRGTPSGIPLDKELTFADYKAEMERLRAVFDHFGRTTDDPQFSENSNVLTVTYTLDMVFARDLQPRPGSLAERPLKANGKRVLVEVTDTVTFNPAGEILTLVSSDQGEMLEQMTA